VRPLIRGRNASRLDGQTHDSWIIWTHSDDDLEPLRDLPPLARAYFNQHRAELMARSDYRDGPAWRIFRVDPTKLGSKVVWPDISPCMKARGIGAFVNDPVLGRAGLIPDKTVFLIPAASEPVAKALCLILNSVFGQVYLSSFAQRLRGGYFHFTSSVVAFMPIPEGLTTGVGRGDGNGGTEGDLAGVGVDAAALGLNAQDEEELASFWSFIEAGQARAESPSAGNGVDQEEA